MNVSHENAMYTWLGSYYDSDGLDTPIKDDPIDKWTGELKQINTVTFHFVSPDDDPGTPTISFHDYYHNSFTRDIGLVKPDPSWGKRRASGAIQSAESALIREIATMDITLNEYDRLIDTLKSTVMDIEQRYNYRVARSIAQWSYFTVVTVSDAAIAVSKILRAVMRGFIQTVQTAMYTADKAPPLSVGIAPDIFSAIRAAAATTGGTAKTNLTIAQDVFATAEDLLKMTMTELGRIKDLTLEELSAQQSLGEFLRKFEGEVRKEPGLRMKLYLELDRVKGKVGAYKKAVAKGNRLIDELIVFRKKAAAITQDHRYRDMFFRIMRNDSLQKYHAQFELTAKYVYLAASAYDYETNLLGTNEMAGRDFLTSIVKQRNLGEMYRSLQGGLVPLPGRAGLADPMARMKSNFNVLKPQLGFNNPQVETNLFSLREQLFRILPDSDQEWIDELNAHRVEDLWSVPEFKRYCRPFAAPEQGPQPGIVIPFTTNVTFGMNFFGWPLSSGDSAYDPSHFATRVRSAGVWFTGYDGLGLSQTPRVYLVPVGLDVLRSPDATNFEVRTWHIIDQKLPVPFPLTLQDVEEPDWIPMYNSLSDDLYDTRQFSAFRAYDDSGGFNPDEMTTDTRLIGRSVWNTRWLLIIPGGYMLSDADAALNSFIQGVDDVKFFFETYAYSGSKKTGAESTTTPEEQTAGQQEQQKEVHDEK
jgi:chorismate mutase